jgi:hypothetical protein
LQRVARLAGGQVVEYACNLAKGFARAVQGGYRILERRRFRIGGDGVNLGPVLGHGNLEGGGEMLRLDEVEGGEPVGRVPGAGERVAVHAEIIRGFA